MLTIKILGTGCSNCKNLEATVKKAVESLGVDAEIVKVTDYVEIMKYPLLATPGLVINERLVAAGRVPKLSQIASFIAAASEG
jgi:small redox-active disulfide protein 2